jgi:ParB family transcriptional regulator, chromosome partitioning protein
MAQQKLRLGRGLDSLISGGLSPAKKRSGKETNSKSAKQKKPEPVVAKTPAPVAPVKEEASVPTNGMLELPIQKLSPNPHQPRREFDPESLKELEESIRSEGLLQPVVVRPVNGGYQLIAGERRWRACQSLGMKKIPARVLEVSEASSAVLSLIENLQRADLNPIEESLGYASLMRDFDLTQEAVAERVGKARASVANALRLLQLDREIQGYISKGILSVGHAKVLLGVESNSERLLLARQVIEKGMSVRDTEQLVGGHKGRNTPNPQTRSNTPVVEDSAIRDLERQISSRLNTRVELKHAAKKGRIVIEYYGNDDLQRIMERMGLS